MSLRADGDPAPGRRLFCAGLAQAEPGGAALRLHDSGPQRRSRLIAADGLELARRLGSPAGRPPFGEGNRPTTPDRWAPYRTIAQAGFVPASAPPGGRLVPLAVYWKGNRAVTLPEHPFLDAAASRFLTRSPIEAGTVALAPFGLRRGFCGPPDSRYRRLWLTLEAEDRPLPARRGWRLDLFELKPGRPARLSARASGARSFVPHRASPAAGLSPEGPVVFMTVYRPRGEARTDSRLLAVDGRTGRVLSETAFRGEHHFSMPLLAGDAVFVATKAHGLKKFVADRSWAARWRRRSVCWGLLRQMLHCLS